MARSRYRTLDHRQNIPGTYKRYIGSGTIEGTTNVTTGLRKEMSDVVGNRDGVNPLHLVSYEYRPYLAMGTRSIDDKPRQEYSSFPVPEISGMPNLPGTDTIFQPMDFNRQQALGFALRAGTSLSAAHVSIPIALAELRDWKDLPDRIRKAGRNWPRQAANAHLTWRWGLAPLIADLKKLIGFTQAVNDRLRLLDRLSRGQGVTRTMMLGNNSQVLSDQTDVLLSTRSGWSIRGNVTDVATERVWGSVRYKPTSATKSLIADSNRLALAHRLAWGFTGWTAVEATWELFPWSWYLDWFSSFGDAIKAMNNTLSVTASGTCLMRTVTVNRIVTVTSRAQGVTFVGPYKCERIRKERHLPVLVNPFAAKIPVLGPGKWSILGSLAVGLPNPLGKRRPHPWVKPRRPRR